MDHTTGPSTGGHSEGDVFDDVAGHRFVLRQQGAEAELVYRRTADRLVLVHTGVPDELGGRGIGGRLVRAAVAQAANAGLTVVPECPFARQWLERHADVAAGVEVSWPGR